MITWVFWITGNVGYAFLDLLLLKGIRRWANSRLKSPASETFPSVTVLVAARNEEVCLPDLISDLRNQDYPGPRLQFLFADDRSTDQTSEILKAAAAEDSRFEWIRIDSAPAGVSPKKNALAQALSHARGEWIVTTDADCRVKPQWIQTLLAGASAQVGMRVGLSHYIQPQNPSLLQSAQAMEFLSYGIVGAGLLGLGFPVHANANNLAYRRQAYLDTPGFKSHRNIVSGDDDFLMQSIHASGQWKIEFCAHPEAYALTRPPATWSEFWEQRKRWASKCGFYAPKQVLFLSLIFAYYAGILGLLLLAPFSFSLAKAGLLGFAVKTSADGLVMAAGGRWLGAPLRFWAFPLTAMIHIPLILGATLWGMAKGFVWKDGHTKSKLEEMGPTRESGSANRKERA